MTSEYELSIKRRDLYLRMVDNQTDFDPITQRLYFLEDHFPPDKLDKALMWLVNNKITGRIFTAWFKSTCQNSDLEMHRQLLHIVDNLQLGRVVAGKNFKV